MTTPSKTTIDHFLQIAIEEAIIGSGETVICDANGTELTRGHNMVMVDPDPTAHAEVVVIRQTAKKLNRLDLSDCTLYSSGQPCPMCMAAIHWAGIKHVYYSSNHEEAEDFGWSDKEFLHRITVPEVEINYATYCPQKNRLQPFKEYQKTESLVM